MPKVDSLIIVDINFPESTSIPLDALIYFTLLRDNFKSVSLITLRGKKTTIIKSESISDLCDIKLTCSETLIFNLS